MGFISPSALAASTRMATANSASAAAPEAPQARAGNKDRSPSGIGRVWGLIGSGGRPVPAKEIAGARAGNGQYPRIYRASSSTNAAGHASLRPFPPHGPFRAPTSLSPPGGRPFTPAIHPMKKTLIVLGAAVAAIRLAAAETREFSSTISDRAEPVAPGKFQPTWASLRQYEVPRWFRDAKFGIWAHWGPQ